jgi:CRP-like cAMP-binding protein
MPLTLDFEWSSWGTISGQIITCRSLCRPERSEIMLNVEDRNDSRPGNSRPLTELLACPDSIGARLGTSALRRDYLKGDKLFAQGAPAEGLFLLLAGDFWRTAEHREKRLSLAPLRSGDLAELGAVLGESAHTYTLLAASPAAALLFPACELQQVFDVYPPLRMHLLEELAREVSRSYGAILIPRRTRNRHVAVPDTAHLANGVNGEF